jgi:hypothetical protein
VLDGTSPVAISPAQLVKLRKLAAELASQRAYLADRRREAEAELARAIAATPPDDSRVLAAHDRIAAQDSALERAQLVARLGARSVLDPDQRAAIEHTTHRATNARPRVTVTSPIASSVYMDGKRIGETPVTTVVAAGGHELRLDAPGRDSLIKHFEVGDSAEVTFDLEPQRRRVQPGVPTPSPLPVVTPAPDPLPGAATGHLTLATKPRTTIYLDARPIGQTPIDLRLTPGRHEIKMIGGDQRTRKTMTFDVTPGQESNLSFSFDD